jgi:hypothetical protein
MLYTRGSSKKVSIFNRVAVSKYGIDVTPVYFTTMSHPHDPHGLRFLINLTKDTIVSNSNLAQNGMLKLRIMI